MDAGAVLLLDLVEAAVVLLPDPMEVEVVLLPDLVETAAVLLPDPMEAEVVLLPDPMEAVEGRGAWARTNAGAARVGCFHRGAPSGAEVKASEASGRQR